MTTVTITPETKGDKTIYRATARGMASVGRTAGEALDNLIGPGSDPDVLVALGARSARDSFGVLEHKRLLELIDRRRAAVASGGDLPTDLFEELQRLLKIQIESTTEPLTSRGTAG